MTSDRDYEKRDGHLIDYQLWQLDNYSCRGPTPDLTVPYLAFVGAAQTFGCFCPEPFPTLVGKRMGIQVLNLGLAGAGPQLHQEPALLKHINNSMIAVVQIFSGRSVSNSEYTIIGGGNLGVRHLDSRRMVPLKFWTEFLQNHPERIAELVAETRRNYIQEMIKLLEAIEVPIVLLWLSVRPPEYTEDPSTIQGLWGEFPQLINREVVEKLKPHADAYLEYHSRLGLPQSLAAPIQERFLTVHYPEHKDAGRVETHNHYYPSPEMHAEVAKLLHPILASL